jgi:hypothetical protein
LDTLRVAEDVDAKFSEGVGELAVECCQGCVFAFDGFRLAVLPASSANRFQDGVAGDSADSRIAKSLIGGFPFLFGELPPRWKYFCEFLALCEFCDHSSAEGDRESLTLARLGGEVRRGGLGFGGADLGRGLGGPGVASCSEAGPNQLVCQLADSKVKRSVFLILRFLLAVRRAVPHAFGLDSEEPTFEDLFGFDERIGDYALVENRIGALN